MAAAEASKERKANLVSIMIGGETINVGRLNGTGIADGTMFISLFPLVELRG
jgi:hypothetical protein